MDLIQTTFDYDQIPAERRGEVRDAAARIKVRMARTVDDIIQIGNDLLEVKENIGHGNFYPWLAAEFSMSKQTALNLMHVAERFGGESTRLVDFSADALYALAAPSTPNEVVEEAVHMAATGEKVTSADIKELKAQWDAERKEFRHEIANLKEKSQDAKATETDALGQIKAMQAELRQLREERETMRAQIAHRESAQTAAVKHADDALSNTEAVEKQVARLVSAWNAASKEAREEFLARIDRPVFDSTRAA